jgi:enoyl-CoA hydratase/carnithine racemase
MTYNCLLYEVKDGVATLTLNRPERMNALGDTLREDFLDAITRSAADPDVRVMIITGAGKAFCAGGDVRGMKQRLEAPPAQVAINGWRRQQRTHHVVAALHALGKPVIAAVNGAAAGLGCDVALCCDFIIASDQASFAMTYIQRGLIPDGGGMYFLPRRVGLVRAKELIFSGRRVAPEEALAIGMIDRVTGAERLLEDAKAWARELSGGSLAALALSKSVLNQTFELTVGQVFDMGSQAQAICYSTQEHRDSIAAFLAKSATKSGDRS